MNYEGENQKNKKVTGLSKKSERTKQYSPSATWLDKLNET